MSTRTTSTCVLLAGRKLSLIRFGISVAVSQLLFHTLFVLGTVTPSGISVPHVHGAPIVFPSRTTPARTRTTRAAKSKTEWGSDVGTRARRAGSTRRQFLLGEAAAGVGAVAAVGVDLALNEQKSGATPVSAPMNGEQVVPFFGGHQAEEDTAAQAHGVFLGLELREDVDRESLVRLMRILTDDAARLTQGLPALADAEPELALSPTKLTIAFGFDPGLVARAAGAGPAWLAPSRLSGWISCAPSSPTATSCCRSPATIL